MGRGQGGSTSYGKRTPGGISTSSKMALSSKEEMQIDALQKRIDTLYKKKEYDEAENLEVKLETLLNNLEAREEHLDMESDESEDFYGYINRFTQRPVLVPDLDGEYSNPSLEEELGSLYHQWINDDGRFEDTGARKDWQNAHPGSTWKDVPQELQKSEKVFVELFWSIIADTYPSHWDDNPRKMEDISFEEAFAAAKDAYETVKKRRDRTRENLRHEKQPSEKEQVLSKMNAAGKRTPSGIKTSSAMKASSEVYEPVVLFRSEDSDEPGVEYEDEDAAYKLANKVGLGITRDRDLFAVMKDGDKVIGAIWTAFDDDEYSFDVAVDPEFQGRGLGSKLTDIALDEANTYRDMSDDVRINVRVTSPREKALLERRGLVVEKQLSDGTWMMVDKPKDAFASKHNFDPEEMSYLGKGDFGEAYSLGDGRVLKETSSRREFEIAQELVGKDIPGFAKIYAAEEDGGKYKIILEELEEDSDIENQFYVLLDMLETQELPIQYLGNFDEDEYTKEHGEISEDTRQFMAELDDILSSYRRLGIEASDIRSENLGRDQNGVLKAFDLDDRAK